MTHPTRRMALTLIAAATLAPAASAQTRKQSLTRSIDLNGSYTVTGRNADGSAYSGRASVRHQGDAVEITWTVGSQTYRGAGLLEGRVLTVEWGDATPVVYVVMPDGALHGTWADGTALDRLTPR
jgi:hypothetical protein